ncbi:MAG: P63C domain-containing protein [Bacteroidetes bacterium]|nr:P63C domain-containing protein [Bacteroidota bacterium]
MSKHQSQDSKKENEIPSTDFVGKIKIKGLDIPCAVLYPDTNPTSVIVQREIVGLLTGNKKGGFERYLKPQNLQGYLPEQFKGKPLSESVITFNFNGRTAQGFKGSDLIDICKMYMQAKMDGNLLENQYKLAEESQIIVFAFAKTGVDAVIYEATGFELFKDRFTFNRLLEKYIDDEIKQWYKKFPDKFYQLIFKLNGWAWEEDSMKRKPSVIGRWTNEIVYSRFPKGILGKLQDKNPMTENGYRKYKHHQLLTDIGNDELKEYISNAIFLMESCANWSKFKRALARATGREYQGDMFEDLG